jgi:hypothetical protein
MTAATLRKSQKVQADLVAALKALRLLVKEVGGNYLAGLQAEVAHAEQAVATAQDDDAPTGKQLAQMQALLQRVNSLDVKPRKGRRRDVKELDKLITKMTATLETW